MSPSEISSVQISNFLESQSKHNSTLSEAGKAAQLETQGCFTGKIKLMKYLIRKPCFVVAVLFI